MTLPASVAVYALVTAVLSAVPVFTGIHALYIPALLWICGGAAVLARRLGALEKGLSLIRDGDLFLRYAKSLKHGREQELLDDIAGEIEALRKQYSTSVSDADTRMGSLQSQINPHFLYNTLECIRSEALITHNDNIASMSKALGLFFRYGISQKENIVSIQAEIDNIRNYCLIQNYRFGDKFILELLIEDEEDRLLDCLIPKMTLQPVVENCIFHGLEPKQGTGKVSIRLAATERLILLTISDDGIGMDEERLLKLRESVENPSLRSAAGRGNGIALYNVNEKLKLVFGKEYGLRVYSVPGEGTDVEMIFPMVRDRGALPV